MRTKLRLRWVKIVVLYVSLNASELPGWQVKTRITLHSTSRVGLESFHFYKFPGNINTFCLGNHTLTTTGLI